jgi:hypothetical protein
MAAIIGSHFVKTGPFGYRTKIESKKPTIVRFSDGDCTETKNIRKSNVSNIRARSIYGL